MQNSIRSGLNDTYEMEVTGSMLAQNIGSGDTAVLATPMLINIIEMLCAKIIKENLDDDRLTSVGTLVNVNHLSPTPKGMKVTAKATITGVDRNKVIFKTEVWDEKDKICTGMHNRVIIGKEKFEKKANDKLN